MRLRESQRLIRLKTKSEMDGLDLENIHPRILGSIFHDFYTGIERIFVRIECKFFSVLPANLKREAVNEGFLSKPICGSSIKVLSGNITGWRFLFGVHLGKS